MRNALQQRMMCKLSAEISVPQAYLKRTLSVPEPFERTLMKRAISVRARFGRLVTRTGTLNWMGPMGLMRLMGLMGPDDSQKETNEDGLLGD